MRIFSDSFFTSPTACLLFVAHIFILHPESAHSKADCKTKLEQCESRKPYHHKQVCGTDNKTYPNRCALIRVQCAQNSALAVKHRGRCKEKQPCWIDQARRMDVAIEDSSYRKKLVSREYVPECLADGTYAPVQCHKAAGYCWCVTAAGKVIPGTSVHHKRPACPKRGKRGSSARQQAGLTKKKSVKDCNQIDKVIFVNNLVRIFKTEYNRDVYFRQHTTQNNFSNADLMAVDWKFMILDKDSNRSLSKNEYRDLRRLVKKVVKPRRCSRVFIQICDEDQNSLISKHEWISCLSLNYSSSLKSTVFNNFKQEESSMSKEDSASSVSYSAEEETEQDAPDLDFSSALQNVGVPLSDHSLQVEEESDSKESEANDCLSDRKAVLDDLRLGSQETYVPECAPDGRYKKIQCYKSTGYCWCVFEDTGKPIPGTSVKDSNPKCELTQVRLPYPMKGCPETKRIPFVKNLIEFFKDYTRNVTLSAGKDDPTFETNEKIISFAFDNLDINKNKVLERKEWKIFRSLMFSNPVLKCCGKKLPRYCDVNHDSKITLTEWTNCLSIQNSAVSGTMAESSNRNLVSFRRRGPNPLSYLKEDD